MFAFKAKHTICTIISLLCVAIFGNAQEFVIDNGITVSNMLSLGHANLLDTYLSNEKYQGTQLQYTSEVLRDSRKSRPMTYSLMHEASLSNTRNRADNASQLSGHYTFTWAAMKRWTGTLAEVNAWYSIMLGGFGRAHLGFCYDTKNTSNNPAQGYADVSIGPQVIGMLHTTKLGIPMVVSYEARIPLVGLMFSPNYGQSYYEIFNEGNYDHNIVFTSIATFQTRQQIALDLYIFKSKTSALRIGYLNIIRQATPHNLKQHLWYNAATIGITIRK